MKNKILYFIPLILISATGCFNTKTDIPPVTPPSGTFTGQFRYLHRHSSNVAFDTVKANLTVTMNSTANTFAVTGDTSTAHAGSKGSFSFGSPYMLFTDNTYPKTGTPAKTHLNGLYLYYYDGTVFQLLAYSADTLSLQYDLKKTQ